MKLSAFYAYLETSKAKCAVLTASGSMVPVPHQSVIRWAQDSIKLDRHPRVSISEDTVCIGVNSCIGEEVTP